jgi:hypothetical protein
MKKTLKISKKINDNFLKKLKGYMIFIIIFTLNFIKKLNIKRIIHRMSL